MRYVSKYGSGIFGALQAMEDLLLAEALRESELLMDCQDNRFSVKFCNQIQL